ncbi:MAG: hypothetical protein RLZZ155_1348 [Bacteroidota bacterium]|jgi:hypothetical protein
MKGVFILLGICFFRLISSAQEIVPSQLYKLKPDRYLINFLPLDSLQQAKPNFNYQLILSRGKWYAVGDGDGQVFTPENGVWKRIDKTRLEGYHYGAFLFDCNGTLMKYGGYGFWRSHGMFVYFHEHLGDWSIQPCDRDLPFSGNMAYFSRKENALYTFGNLIYNQSNSEEKIYLDSLYRIDMLKMKWENLGKLNFKLIDKYHLHNRLKTLSNKQGCLILPISTDSSALYFNLEKLKYGVYNSSTNPKLFRFLKELPNNTQLYSDAYGLKILNYETLICTDSLSWEDALKNPIEESEIIDGHTPLVTLKYAAIFGAIGLTLGIILLIYLVRKKKNKAPLNSADLSNEVSNTLDLSIQNTIVFEGAMYPINELDYEVIRKFAIQEASTLDLNDWLGLENKQPENQKKQRAEWIKRLNAFFKSIGFKEDAFKRERQETDKRMFVYKMNTKLKVNHPLH